MHQLIRERNRNLWVSTCLSSLHLSLSTEGAVVTSARRAFQMVATLNEKSESIIKCSFFDVRSFEWYLEQSGGDFLLMCWCWGNSEYLIFCIPISIYFLFSYSWVKTFSNAGVCLHKIYASTLLPTWLLKPILGVRDLHLFWRERVQWYCELQGGAYRMF